MAKKYETWFSSEDEDKRPRPPSPTPEPAAEVEAEDTFGPYRLLEQIGQGAQGSVYLAEDTRLHRKVALKIIHDSLLAEPEVLERFQREAAVTARLDHPGVCATYDAGEHRGVPYIAMRYVDGEPLSDRIDAAREAGGDCLRFPDAVDSKTAVLRVVSMVERAARALEAAHHAGIIHRDIKPQNIMLHRDGDPVLLDFGLAGELAADTQLTRAGQLFGTPHYMSPEQLTRQSIRVDRRTDVYSLGVVLYECLTLQKPFDGPTMESLFQAILTKEPKSPQALNPAIPRDLKTVLETALDKNRDRRYASAADLADDLRAVAESRPVRAKPISSVGRAIRWSRREPAKAVLFMVLAVLVPAITAMAGYESLNAEEIERGLYVERRSKINALLVQGDLAALEKRRPDAREAYAQAVELDPENVWAAGMAAMYMEPAAAVAFLRPQAEAKERDPKWAARLAFAFARAGNVDEARRWSSVPGAAKTAFSHFTRGLKLLKDGGDADECARQLSLAAFKTHEPRLSVLAMMAVSSAGAKDLRRAGIAAQAIITLWPNRTKDLQLVVEFKKQMKQMKRMEEEKKRMDEEKKQKKGKR